MNEVVRLKDQKETKLPSLRPWKIDDIEKNAI